MFRKVCPYIIILLLAAIPQVADAYAIPLITSSAQLSTNGNASGLEKLIDASTSTVWNSTGAGDAAGGNHYIEVKFDDANMPEGEIWAKITHNGHVNVTAMRIEVTNDPATGWTHLCDINVLYRHNTGVYIGPFTLPADACKYMRFTTLQDTYNAANTPYDTGTENLKIVMSEFQILKYSEDMTNATSSVDWIDPYHIRGYPGNQYADYAFQHTIAYLGQNQDNASYWKEAAASLWDADGNFLREAEDGAVLAANGIHLPDFKYIDNSDDSRIVSGIRQPSHITEHTVYAIPGDVIMLYPYSDMATSINYYQSYARWYDYSTDLACRYIDCLHYPNGLQKTPDGLFGSNIFAKARARGAIATFLCPPQEEMPEQDLYVAVDFSFTSSDGKVIQTATQTIKEPVVHYRHIFTIRDGRKQAEELSATAENNAQYISRTRHRISARAGVDFQQRLDYVVPTNNQSGNLVGYSNLYYKTTDGRYHRINSAAVETYDESGTLKAGMFTLSASYNGAGSGEYESFFDQGRKFERFIYLAKAKATAGKFIVKLFALDEKGNRLKTADGLADIQIAEYEITLLPSAEASFVNETTLATDEYFTHREAYLEANVGTPISKIDYDEYRAIESIKDPTNKYNLYTCPSTSWSNGMISQFYRWPLQWEQSNYAFGYSKLYDYSAYVVANHSGRTPYHAAADLRKAADNFGVADGLFDRRFYNTEGQEAGYFYYVNAAGDPGVIASLDIKDLCSSSRIYVSAWVAEFSNDGEVANVIFNFIANLAPDSPMREVYGDKVAIHSFSTGYVTALGSDKGKWMHAYYSFNPNFKALGLTNADIDYFSIDLENNCKSSGGADYAVDDIRVYVAKPRVYAEQQLPLCNVTETTMQVQVQIPFSVLLASLGESEATSSADMKTHKVFYTILDKADYENAYMGIADNYTMAFENAIVRYQYMADDPSETQTYGWFTFVNDYASNGDMCQIIDDEEMLVFTTQPTDEDLATGKEYYIILYISPENEELLNEQDLPTLFDLNDMCVKMSTLRVKSSTVVKIDGVPIENPDNIQACTDQMPIVQLDLYGQAAGGTALELIQENAFFDWYKGSNIAYGEEQRNGLTLDDAITYFRLAYPTGEAWDVATTDEYTDEVKTYIGDMVQSGKLILYRNSYMIHTSAADLGSSVYVTAIPIDIYTSNYQVCTSNIEIKWDVTGSAPVLAQGFRQISYPEDMTERSIRIGLAQIRQASTLKSATPTSFLAIPIRNVQPASLGVTTFKGDDTNPYLYLIDTDDPEYHNLSDEFGSEGLMEVGLLHNITAVKDGTDNLMEVSFFTDFKFKEGYYYRLKFHFKEDGVAASDTTEATEGTEQSDKPLCTGELAFILKVVPEYQKWSGTEGNLNWDNDSNWSRVSSADLFRTISNDNYTTDGPNSQPNANFAPASFTKVIIPAGATYPTLYHIPSITIEDFNGDGTGVRSFAFSQPDIAPEAVGSLSEDAMYDLCAYTSSSNIYLQPWHAQICDQIHFVTDAEILGQHWLTYKSAWYELEVTPGRWYTLASPLQHTYSGFMYLPMVGARQQTELFKSITFDTKLYNRFNPAVYQRGWDKATAKVYEYGQSAAQNVAIRASWSNVYNDVAELYSPGIGYSIKVDSDVEAALFRLPKSDTRYVYYNDAGKTGHSTNLKRDSVGRFLYFPEDMDFTLKAAASAGVSRYYLVGNPFMAHLDMSKFLAANSHLITPKYWIMTEGSQRAAIMSGDGTFAAAGDETLLIAPLQGFFVELKDDVTPTADIAFTFNADMAALAPISEKLRSHATRAAADVLTISASDGDITSYAAIRRRDDASGDYDANEDVIFIDDSKLSLTPRVYTLAGNVATTINSTPADEAIPLCVLAPDGKDVTLTFSGTDALRDACLYDAAMDELTPLYDGVEYRVTGSSQDRLFITASVSQVLQNYIEMVVNDRTLTVFAHSAQSLSVMVYDVVGNVSGQRSADGGSVQIPLSQGVYIVRATADDVEQVRKIYIR